MSQSYKEEYHYAKWYDPLLYPFIQPIRRYITDWIKVRGYSAVLDVCCGTGDQLKQLSKEGISGEGVDLSESMLSVAKSGKSPARCFKEDASAMHYAESSFDLVMTTFALHEKNPQVAREIVEEMVRVTKEKGEMLIVDYELGEKTSFLSRKLIGFIEWLAGGEHYANFQKYLEMGGLPKLLKGLPLKEVKRHYFGQHGIVLVVLRKV
jgi:demethylmenaquinone methyltransferase/2-methoxy-6-polyprenyl-1,4-benzoquinol methylase